MGPLHKPPPGGTPSSAAANSTSWAAFNSRAGAGIAVAPDDWLASAKEHPGSWRPVWAKWAGRHGGGKVAARVPGDGRLEIIEDAPGSYVKVRAQD